MSNEEFADWWNDMKLRFPSVKTWIARHAPEASQQQAMLRTWRTVLVSANAADCLEVNAKMQCGELPFVGEYDGDKEKIPLHVSRLARQIAADRRPSENREQFAPSTAKSGGFPAKQILLRLWELKRGGMDHDEARATALREYPVGQSPFREPRYNCGTCLDSGRVLIASNTAIEAMLMGRFPECHHRDGVAKCHCRGHEEAKPKRPIVIYDPQQDFKIEDPLWRPAEVQRFTEWVDWQREHRAEEAAKRHVGYDPQLAAFNRGGSF